MYLFIFPSTLFLLAYVNCIFVKKLIKKKKGGVPLKYFYHSGIGGMEEREVSNNSPPSTIPSPLSSQTVIVP